MTACFCVGPPGDCPCMRRNRYLQGIFDNPWPNIWNIPLDAPVRLEKDRKERAREGAVDILIEYFNSIKAEKYYFWLGEEAERS